MTPLLRPLMLLSCCTATSAHALEVKTHTNEQSGLITYTAEGDGFSLELIQLLPDFIRAIYSKHEFPKSEVEDIASYCVFGSIIKNTTDQLLIYDVSKWRYQDTEGNWQPVKTKTQWMEQWRRAGVIFSWTLLPDYGEFYEGDWQQGFTTIKMPRDSRFDLRFNWSVNGELREVVLEDLACPPTDIEVST